MKGTLKVNLEISSGLRNQAIILGFGRIGQSIGNFLGEENIPFIAVALSADG